MEHNHTINFRMTSGEGPALQAGAPGAISRDCLAQRRGRGVAVDAGERRRHRRRLSVQRLLVRKSQEAGIGEWIGDAKRGARVSIGSHISTHWFLPYLFTRIVR